ncbi:hypothetical protein LCGC14_1495860 [marine sediment metagenome]|uniref:Uncharacterized protein n=1 Tax=marine sediment metagenome TaxID=412755 RepID=A0A0F9JRC6_9ZZZZ
MAYKWANPHEWLERGVLVGIRGEAAREPERGELAMQVTLYDPKDPERVPPHAMVQDAEPPSLRWSYEEQKDAERRHREELEKGEERRLYHWPCACCDWKDPGVKKARAKKLKVLNRFLKTGKLPPVKVSSCGKARTPRKMTDAEAARIVLPDPPLRYKTCTAALTMQPEDKIIKDACSRYLEAMGETRRDGGDTWTCGCKITRSYEEQHCDPCERHRGAFEGTENNES